MTRSCRTLNFERIISLAPDLVISYGITSEINELGGVVPIKDQAMIWLISKAVDGGEFNAELAYSFRLNEDAADSQTLWVDFCESPKPGESVALNLSNNTVSMADTDKKSEEYFYLMMGMPSDMPRPGEEFGEMPAMAPTPVEVRDNSHVIFDTAHFSHTISRPLAELAENAPG